MEDQLTRRIRECSALPTLPAVAVRVLELMEKDKADVVEIGRVISKDPALASKILQTVNSSFFGLPQKVSRISRALTLLGLSGVKTLALGFSLVNCLKKNRPRGFRHLHYWRRSLYAAIAARTICGRAKIAEQEECFLSALLMDVGMLVLDQVVTEEYGEIHKKAATHTDLCRLEMRALGMTHADATAIVAENWNFPAVLRVPMTFHHRPEEAPDPAMQALAEVVSLAGRCADVFVDERPAPAIADVRAICDQRYEINESQCNALLDEICRKTGEVAPLLEININTSANLETVMKKANQMLVRLTLHQHATMEEEKQQLKRQAATDGLTSLANRAGFDQCLGRLFANAVRQKEPVALLLMDIDHFKAINDRHGHQTGDQVIQAVAKLIQAAVRGKGLAARYGGEEMAVILPRANAAFAARVARSIQQAVATRPLSIQSQQVQVTLSIGVAVMEPRGPFQEAAHLVRAADLAMYNAKHSGRNCVRVFAINEPCPAAPALSGAAG